MVEIVALIIALLCLVNNSAGAAAFFLVVGVGAAAWRGYRAREAAKQAQQEITALRADLQRVTSLAERAVRIAAETANSLSSLQHGSVAEPPPETPAATTPQRKEETRVVEKPATAPPMPVAPPVEKVQEKIPVAPDWAAHTKTPPPIAPKIIDRPAPVASVPATPVPPVPPTPKPPGAVPKTTPSDPDNLYFPMPVAAAPRKSLGERARSTLALEEILGTNWLNKIGIIILVLGIALFGTYELGRIGPLGKVGLSLAVSVVLLGGGIYLERRERYQVLGRTGIGGGWALLFFASYAMNHVTAMRVMNSEVLDSILMLIVAGAMVAHTLRYRSQLVTGLAFLLAYSTIALSHDTVYSLIAGAILAAALVTIVVKLSWFELEIFAILASYGNHFFWLYRLLGESGAQGHSFPEFIASSSLLIFYWAAFRASYVVRKVRSVHEENLSTLAGILNPVLLLAVMKFQSAHPEFAFYALLVLGAFEFSIGQLGITKRRRAAFVLLTIIGTALMIAAIPFRYSGQNVSIVWLLGAEVLLFAGVLNREVLFRRLGLITGLLVAGNVLLIDLPRLVAAREASSGTPFISQGVLFLAMAIVFYANNAALRLRWPQFFSDRTDDVLLTATSYPGAITLGIACWDIFVGDGTAVGFAGAMLSVAILSFFLKSRHLQIQFLVIGLIASFRALVFNTHAGMLGHLTARIISLSALAALFYLTAKFAQHKDDSEQRIFRGIFAVIGTAMVALLLLAEVPKGWEPLAFAVFALALTEAAHLAGYLPLRWHTHAMSVAAFVLAATYDVTTTPRWHFLLHVGFWKLVPVVAVLYILAIRVSRAARESIDWVRTAYSWAGTLLALWVLFQSLDDRYVAAAWVLYAVALTLVSRWIRWPQLARQAFVVGAVSAIQAAVINLLAGPPAAHNTVRLVVSLIVIVSLYVMSEILRLPDDWHRKQFAALHSWLATALAGLLMWYELSPPSIALGWALLALAIYEYGELRKAAQMRWQAYLVLCASFVRMFFANLSNGNAGDWLSTRMVTVLPIAAIYYYVYARETSQSASTRFKPAPLFAYLGSIAIMALLYFQFAQEWVVTAWAALVMIVLAISLLLKQSIFVQQCILIAAAVLARGLSHNLFGGSYFSGTDWRGRFAVLGSAILLLFASLPLAFEYRRRSSVDPSTRGIRRVIALLEHRVEQPLFFVAVALLTSMLLLKMDHGMVTLAWGMEGVLIFISALFMKERSFRLTGLSILLLCVGKILVLDVWHLELRDKFLTFMVLGASLILVSFLYSKYRETIRQYL